jgi:predicted Zn-dependent protease
MGLGVASVISPTAAQYAGVAEQGLGLLMLKYGRDDETQADGLGYGYMTRARWDPREAVKMFQMVMKTSGTDKEGQPPAWMSTHPDPGDRAERAAARLKELKEIQIPTAGGPSVSAAFAAQAQQGVVEGETTFLTVKGRMFQVVTAAGQGNLQTVDAIHRKVVASAKETTDPAILNIRAPQVKVVQLPRAMTVEQFYSQFPSVLPLDQVLIINGLEPGAQLKQGDLIKQVVAGTTR